MALKPSQSEADSSGWQLSRQLDKAMNIATLSMRGLTGIYSGWMMSDNSDQLLGDLMSTISVLDSPDHTTDHMSTIRWTNPPTVARRPNPAFWGWIPPLSMRFTAFFTEKFYSLFYKKVLQPFLQNCFYSRSNWVLSNYSLLCLYHFVADLANLDLERIREIMLTVLYAQTLISGV